MKEICHKDMLMCTSISLITHCDQHTFFLLWDRFILYTYIKYVLPPPSPARDFPSEQNLLVRNLFSTNQVALGVRFFKIN